MDSFQLLFISKEPPFNRLTSLTSVSTVLGGVKKGVTCSLIDRTSLHASNTQLCEQSVGWSEERS